MSSEKVHANCVAPRGEGLICTLPPRRLNRRNLTRPSWSIKPTTKRRTGDSPGIRPPATLLAIKEKDSTTTSGTETRRSSLKRRTANSRRLLNKVLKDPANIGVFGALVVTTTVDAFLNFFDQARVERFDQGLDPDPVLEGEEEDYAPIEAKNETQELSLNSEIQQEAEIKDSATKEVKTKVHEFDIKPEIQQEAKNEVAEIKDIDVQVIEQDPKKSIFSSAKDSTSEKSEVGLESLKSENDFKVESEKPVNIDSSVVPTSAYSSLFTTGKQPLQERATIKQKERVPVRKEASLLSPSILRRSPTNSTGPGSRGNDPRNEGKKKSFSTVVKKEEGDRIGTFRNDMIPVIAGILFGIVALKWITGTVFTKRTLVDPTTSTSVVQVEPPPPKKSIYEEYEAFDESDVEMDDYGKGGRDENEF